MANPLRVVILKDGDIFVAQCLEYDVAAQGKTEEQAIKRLKACLRAEEEIAAAEGRELSDIGPAPEAFHAVYDSDSISKTQLKMVA
jgi:predicted RNase H-like HicB family nuclease